MHTISITPKAPYDFSKMTRRLLGVQHELYRYEDGRLVRTIRVGGNVYLVRIASSGSVESPKLEVEVHGSNVDRNLASIQKHLENMLSVELDLLPFYRHVEQDARLANLARRYYGLRFILEADPFECMIKTIIGQQLNLAFAAALNRRLIELASQPYVCGEKSYPVFPSAEQVAGLSYDQLRQLQFSQRKAEYVIDFARSVVEGKVDFEQWNGMENERIIEQLCRMRGIGRWTAECFLLFGLGRTDLLPAADIGLRNAVKQAYGMDRQPTEQEIRALGKWWSPWSSYVTFYLWESLNQGA